MSPAATSNARAPIVKIGNLRDAQKEMTRTRLIEAAIAVFEEEGYRAAKIEQITQRAGATRPTFYLHFRSKAEIALAIGKRLEPDVRAFLHRLDAMDKPSREDIRDWLTAVAEFLRSRSVEWSVGADASTTDGSIAERHISVLSTFSDSMPRYLSRFPPERREQARMRLLLQTLQLERAFFLVIARGHSKIEAALIESMADIWWNVLYRDVL